MYAQRKLRDTFGFQILNIGNEPHFTDRFVVVSAPRYCSRIYYDLSIPENQWLAETHRVKCEKCKKLETDKPVICSSPPTYDYDMNEVWEKNHEWIDLFTALKLISLTERFSP